MTTGATVKENIGESRTSTRSARYPEWEAIIIFDLGSFEADAWLSRKNRKQAANQARKLHRREFQGLSNIEAYTS